MSNTASIADQCVDAAVIRCNLTTKVLGVLGDKNNGTAGYPGDDTLTCGEIALGHLILNLEIPPLTVETATADAESDLRSMGSGRPVSASTT